MKHDHLNRSFSPATAIPAVAVVALAALAVGGSPGATGVTSPNATTRDATSHDAGMNCRAVSTRTMQSLRSTLASALSAADSDARQNGRTGEYAVAATNARDQIRTSLARADRMIADHNKIDPSSTTYAEAGTTKEHTRWIIERLPQAAHWAAVSNIYHDSRDARRAFDLATQALDQGQTLFVQSSNCYMDGFR